MFHIVLVEPEIPPNTGNIGRLCVGSGSDLYLVGKLGFEITDRRVKRAGLDYWEKLTYYRYPSLDDLIAAKPGGRFIYTSARANTLYTEMTYRDDDFLVFGKETQGLGEEFILQHLDTTIKIPIFGPIRSFNLANSAAIILYEALRQVKQF
jgi:tRNA (cytidine/uridine-2'-O-)-methyltransferase